MSATPPPKEKDRASSSISVWKNIFKWKKILQECENLNAEIEVEEAAYAGFPDPLRGFIWFALLRAGQLRRSISSDYVDYLERETTECGRRDAGIGPHLTQDRTHQAKAAYAPE